MVQLLNRSGWVSSWTVGLGGFATASIGGAEDIEWFDSGSWHAGPFGVLDILVPELMHTRYSLYAGLDYMQVRAGWYPFWGTLENALVPAVTGNLEMPKSKDIEGADRTYIGFSELCLNHKT